MKNSFTESDLRFRFGQNWIVKKYDDQKYFQAFSGHGYKGIDFLGIKDNRELLMMEVKNYNIRVPEETIIETLNDPDKISDTFITKVEDSLSGVNAIAKYFERRWWYTPACKLYSMIGEDKLYRKNFGFWPYVNFLRHSTEHKAWFLLWLETEQEYEGLSKRQLGKVVEHVNQRIQKYFKHKPCVAQVVNMASNPFTESLQVEAAKQA